MAANLRLRLPNRSHVALPGFYPDTLTRRRRRRRGRRGSALPHGPSAEPVASPAGEAMCGAAVQTSSFRPSPTRPRTPAAPAPPPLRSSPSSADFRSISPQLARRRSSWRTVIAWTSFRIRLSVRGSSVRTHPPSRRLLSGWHCRSTQRTEELRHFSSLEGRGRQRFYEFVRLGRICLDFVPAWVGRRGGGFGGEAGEPRARLATQHDVSLD